MVTIQGLSGIPEPKSNRTEKVKGDRNNAPAAGESGAASGAAAKDGVQISPEAKQAAEVQRVLQVSKTQEEIRAEQQNDALHARILCVPADGGGSERRPVRQR